MKAFTKRSIFDLSLLVQMVISSQTIQEFYVFMRKKTLVQKLSTSVFSGWRRK